MLTIERPLWWTSQLDAIARARAGGPATLADHRLLGTQLARNIPALALPVTRLKRELPDRGEGLAFELARMPDDQADAICDRVLDCLRPTAPWVVEDVADAEDRRQVAFGLLLAV